MFQFYLNKSHYNSLKKKSLWVTKSQGKMKIHTENKKIMNFVHIELNDNFRLFILIMFVST